ncbi:MAG: hypothetical protein IJO73_02030 [Clostridia bacterium]|nr:hypothetical protein [Clostridia bacterium]
MAADIIIKSLLFEKYGVQLISTDGEDKISFRAFLQPLRYKNKIYLSGVPTELGYDGLNKYLLLAPPEVDIKYLEGEGFTLYFDESSFSTDHCEPVYLGRKKLYYWAIVHKEG